MNTPTKRYADDLQDWQCQTQTKSGRWVLSRAYGYQGLCLLWRLECAWLVFTGKADVLLWNGDQ